MQGETKRVARVKKPQSKTFYFKSKKPKTNKKKPSWQSSDMCMYKDTQNIFTVDELKLQFFSSSPTNY